ncbi:helix-turn-helix domain-containing protein [Marinagarivorans algicola]|uniref:helix-turn-helix domain-containing protein n=1 Tax=Marinagarivorans algicola TaxID=1513270 RepID=UPI002368B6AC|nr:helix-turn-helix domain-containing protein [Marinagarivorans algicola]
MTTSIEIGKKAQTLDLSASWVDLKTIEKQYIQQLMHTHAGDKEVVAGICGISLRSLYRKLEGT